MLDLKPGESIVDLGAAYCRMAFVLARHYPGVKFLGIECVPQRVAEAQRILKAQGHEHFICSCADLSCDEFEIPRAQAYFIYDCGTRSDIEKTLNKLRDLHFTQGMGFRLVARGLRVRAAIDEGQPWLFKTGPLLREADFMIYACDWR
jgi:hypothetical protein